MGDNASSLCALGFHERVDERINHIPEFLAELRRACFARIYAADKSLAIFLGRPPRIVEEFCFLQLPTLRINLENIGSSHRHLNGTERMDYTADTFCSTLFASLKEEALLMLRKRHLVDQTTTVRWAKWCTAASDIVKILTLKGTPTEGWRPMAKVASSLSSQHQRTVLRFRAVSAGLPCWDRARLPTNCSLDWLGLARKAIWTRRLSVDSGWWNAFHKVEVIILRDRLVNSGTSLIWKVRISQFIPQQSLYWPNYSKFMYRELYIAEFYVLTPN